MQIYLDYSATTPPRSEAIAAMHLAMEQHWGNPSSLHYWGNRAATALERSRLQVASLINAATPESIVFTAGGTEANNLAILGVTQQFSQPQHLIVSAVEHSAVAEPMRHLADQGWQVSWLPTDRYGLVSPADLQQALQANTVLVSIIYGQSEVGTLQPIAELGAIAQNRGVLFHTDAVQVAGRLPIDVQQLPVDMLSLSSHKIYGPQGAGALYIRPQNSRLQNSRLQNSRPQNGHAAPIASLAPVITGGGQESGLRSGTQALPALVGFGVAAELAAADMPTETLRLIHLRDRFFALLQDHLELAPTGHPRQRLPHHASFCLPHQSARESTGTPLLSGKDLVRQMNLAGIGISAGSACHSGQLSPSPILSAMGYDAPTAKTGIRLTLGKQTTAADVDWSAMVLKQILARTLPHSPPVTA
ncbi:MAG: cysteine desulfurase family protein [Phormidesmis sp.]